VGGFPPFQTAGNGGAHDGNAAIDGEVVGQGWRMALEIKSTHDDIVRGLGQLAEALAHGYDSAALVTSLRNGQAIEVGGL